MLHHFTHTHTRELTFKFTASSHKINKLIHNIPFIATAGLLFFPFCRLSIVVVDAAASVPHMTGLWPCVKWLP